MPISTCLRTRSSDEVRGGIGRSLASVAHNMADKLDRGMWARSGEVSVLATLVTQLGGQDLAAIRGSLDQLRRAIPVFSWIGYTDARGRVLAASDGLLEGVDISKRPVYLHGVNGTFVGDVHDAVLLAKALPNPSGEPMKFVDVSTPIKDAQGRVVGVLGAHLSWAWARELRDSVLAARDTAKDTELFVVAIDNTVLARQPAKLAYKPVARLQRDVMLWGAGAAAAHRPGGRQAACRRGGGDPRASRHPRHRGADPVA